MRSTKLIYLVLPMLMVLAVFLAMPTPASARPAQVVVGISVGIAPPPLPYYEQPICPGEGYIWTPGYWAWDGTDYYWVPGTWVMAPFVGGYWTPGYWGWGGSAFFWHEGYWGPEVGFYGGIDYGYGYGGVGYEGGRWDRGAFRYNTSVTHVDVNVIHNTYEQPVTRVEPGRVAYNGGTGGIQRQPTAGEEAAAGKRRVGPTSEQSQHDQAARSNPTQHFASNHGQPGVAATGRAGDFSHGQPATTRPEYRPPTEGGNNGGNTGGHPSNATPHENAPAEHNNPPAHTNAPAEPNNPPAEHNNPPARTNAPTHENAPPANNNPPAHTNPPPHENPPAHPAPAPKPAKPPKNDKGSGGDQEPKH